MIPILTAIIPLIPGLIQGVENIFGAKKGPDKKAAVVNMIAAAIAQARDAGVLGEQDGNALQIAAIVEGVLQSMKAQGQLVEVGKPAASLAAGTRFQFIGTVVEIG